MSIGEGISLLIVEEDKHALDVCCRILGRCFPQMAVHATSDPDEALSLFEKVKHDIVLTDVFSSTGEIGIRIAVEVCSENPNVKVIFITSNQEIQSFMSKPYARAICMESIVNKPIDVSELIITIKKAIMAIHHDTPAKMW